MILIFGSVATHFSVKMHPFRNREENCEVNGVMRMKRNFQRAINVNEDVNEY